MRYVIPFVLLSVAFPCAGQSITLNTAYYDSLHQILLASNLTHYRMYFKDSVAYEWVDPSCDNADVNTASLMKSFTSLAVGELLENGYIKSLDDPVCDYIPEWQAGCENDVTIRHLITMTSGVLRKPHAERVRFFTTNDWNSFVLNMDLDTTPGIMWGYSNEAGQLLEPIIANASGMDVQQFFDRYVFEPMNMNQTSLLQDSAGNYSTIGGATTTMDDLSNMGLCILNNGKFNGQQVIDPGYLEKALTSIDQNPYYGYLWWIDEENSCYTAMGDGGVMIMIFPDKELVFVRAHNCKDGPYSMNWMGPDYTRSISKIVRAAE